MKQMHNSKWDFKITTKTVFLVIIGAMLVGNLVLMSGCSSAGRAASLPFRAVDSALRGLDNMFRNPGPTIDRALQAGSKAASYSEPAGTLSDNYWLENSHYYRHTTPVAFPGTRAPNKTAHLTPARQHDTTSHT